MTVKRGIDERLEKLTFVCWKMLQSQQLYPQLYGDQQ